ncbi:MAG TPA: DUF4349 domain-containing protein, partial [Solirubrobacteraceae bacterium]|nr:DUF4349 domain-containing protein [Solirubrobacteraceae bacterium]
MWRPDRPGDRLTEDQARELEALDRILAGTGAATEAEGRLAGVIAAVRDDRPPLGPAFAAELDARVAAGFPRRRGRPGRGRGRSRSRSRGAPTDAVAGHGVPAGRPLRPGTRHWLAGLGALATLAAAVAVVAGAGQPTGTSSGGRGGRVPAITQAPGAASRLRAPVPPQPSSSSASAGAVYSAPAVPVPAPGPPVAPSTGGPRAVARDATLGLVAPRGQVQAVTDRAIAATDRFGGIVESSQVALDDQGSSQASLELQVPSASLDRALAALSSLAHVASRTQNALDITDTTTAAGDRLAQARAERGALLRQLARATTAGELASIRAELALVGGRIASDQAQLGSLLSRGRLAHVSVTIAEDPL